MEQDENGGGDGDRRHRTPERAAPSRGCVSVRRKRSRHRSRSRTPSPERSPIRDQELMNGRDQHRRVPPKLSHVVRQILFPDDSPNSADANRQNTRNLLIEAQNEDYERARRRYNFDIRKEVLLPNPETDDPSSAIDMDNERADNRCDVEEFKEEPKTADANRENTRNLEIEAQSEDYEKAPNFEIINETPKPLPNPETDNPSRAIDMDNERADNSNCDVEEFKEEPKTPKIDIKQETLPDVRKKVENGTPPSSSSLANNVTVKRQIYKD